MRLMMFSLSFLIFSFAYGVIHQFEFVSNKVQGSLNKEFIGEIICTFNPDIFFETGTYNGETAINAAQFLDKVITVEIYPPIFQQVQQKFSLYPHIKSYLGNSSEIIPNMSSQLNGALLFWLDAHYSGEGLG